MPPFSPLALVAGSVGAGWSGWQARLAMQSIGGACWVNLSDVARFHEELVAPVAAL